MKLLFLLLFLLSACSSISQKEQFNTILFESEFQSYEIQASLFLLTSYERVNIKGGVANVYIEGDGRAWLSKRTPSLDPTPKNPIMLELATLDDADNVIYLARPCQYTKLIKKGVCLQKYWTSHRFAPEVIESMNMALNDMKQRHQITEFNLIGYSGGGNVAALLTAQRGDVLSLRTIAGNLDHDKLNRIHNVDLMPHSLNAKDIAQTINHVPQVHFIGEEDKIVNVDIFQSFSMVSQRLECIKSVVIPNVSHNKGWQEIWRTLLQKHPICQITL